MKKINLISTIEKITINVGYYNNDTFIYVDMNSRSIFDSEMFNPNSL